MSCMKGCRGVGISVYVRNPACVFVNTCVGV